MSKLGMALSFSLGAICGGLAAWAYLRKQYEAMVEEDVADVKEALLNMYGVKEKKEKKAEKVDEPKVVDSTDIREYASVLAKRGYVNYSDKKVVESTKAEVTDAPRVISPEEFGEIDEYECVSLTYYADGVLTDEVDEVINDVEGTVGQDSFNHFGEYEDDSVFIRNDKMKTDYEILADLRNYSDVKKTHRPT